MAQAERRAGICAVFADRLSADRRMFAGLIFCGGIASDHLAYVARCPALFRFCADILARDLLATVSCSTEVAPSASTVLPRA